LQEEYAAPGRGILLAEVAGGYQLRTIAESAEYVKTLIREKPNRLSRAALETLAIIAYRQPITKAEVETVRGVDVDGVLNSLLTKKLIRIMGRKDVPGRPWVYGTTPQFLELFGLNDLSSLPPLPEIHEPTANPYSEVGFDANGTITEDSEPSGDLLAPDGGADDSGGAVQVNGEKIAVGTTADPGDSVTVDGRPLSLSHPPIYLILHKPVGVDVR
jgi:segregation and condensation protein B